MQRLATRISLGYALATAVTVAVGLFAAVQFADLGGSVGRILEENYRSVRAAENMLEEVERQEALLREAERGAPLAPGELEARRDAFARWYGEAERGAALPEEPALLDSIGQAFLAFSRAADRAAVSQPSAASRSEASRAADQLRRLLLRLFDLNQAAMQGTRARVERAAERATWTVLVTAGLAAAASLLATLAFAGSVTRPLRRLTASVRRVREGHLDERVPVTTSDEIGELGQAFNQMTEQLEAYDALNVQTLTAERDRAEAERQKTASLVEAMPSPVVVTDGGGRVVLLNRAAKALASDAVLDEEGRPLSEVVPALAHHLDATDTEESLLQLPVEGSRRDFRLRQTLVRGAEGVTVRIVLLEDITPFQDLDRARREFVATVSHELRTPLTSLGIALDLLRDGLAGPIAPAQQDLLATAKADRDRLKRLVSDLTALARLEAGESAPTEEADLAAVVATALEGLRLPSQEADVRLSTAFEGAPPLVRGNTQQLGWVVTNLVANAIRHAPAGTAVTVRGRVEGGQVRVEVEDAGPGVPAGAAERIFEPFVQVDEENHRPGTAGLGLAIARRAVEAHGGRIWTEPRAGGGLFVFTLPLAPPS